ncbi:uncharacterized protein BT62DRAFT_971781 [Guyanagaster necrorhizus]|uniref:Yeast cell wall synthesis Kre9/Knh1-like N-terminal domain-containing protein n=1 Tax=Guyanagaster necrorhizus TaxID=856835 RepID=A0A9P8AQH0_9AGAR|nr:uncharacterized protein BT62DRAFT_971781 [Guyanagaster necrorhizus MCA 3950]KAG7443975.1 hypothetical protein BT62DRAFT_971781 [Guyanagaster necrorhizus MCA 3950]
MFSKLFTITVISAIIGAYADVVPTVPGPGDSYDEGDTCVIEWTGDKSSTTAWKDMAIELMTGSNTAMVHITTVATGQDGTADGSYNYTCPDVTPNSAIYFYQFTAPAAANTTWVTRFTIASTNGKSTTPTNSTQPDGSDIAWGTGALVDPSLAVAAPDFSSNSTSATYSASVMTTSTVQTTTEATSLAASDTTSTSTTEASAKSTNSNSAKTSNGAVNFGAQAWQALMVMGVSSVVFAILL